MKKTKIPQYYYHITDKYLGDKVTLNPIDSFDSNKRADGEPEIARICVAPTPQQCLVAIPYWNRQSYYIYKTTSKKNTVIPWDVMDMEITEEKWFLEDTQFKLYDSIFIPHDFPLEKASTSATIKKPKKLLTKIEQYIKTQPLWK